MSFDTPANAARSLPFFSLRAMAPDKKLLAAFVYSLAVSLLDQPVTALGACVFSLLLLFCSGLPSNVCGKRLASVNVFFLLLWILLPLSFFPRGGEVPAYNLGPLALYPSGLKLALLITLKGNAIAIALMALTGSSTVVENGRALIKLGTPRKLVALLLVTHSNLALMAREYKALFQAAKLRAFTPRSNFASYSTYARLVGLLLVRSWQHARRVDEAMHLRGFSGRFPLLPSRCTCPPEVREKNRRAAIFLATLCMGVGAGLLLWDKLFL
ncbi:cobalt ECF transporter T component CbiQ [Desulfovibrio sp. OttesenSCG-928-M14]|nr:cobalt ECF transporter T component CbiQ [Desulfovibrio sp. OttesenSCG-928-M14]